MKAVLFSTVFWVGSLLLSGIAQAQTWSTSGNSGTGTEVLGTTNAQPVSVVTDGTERLLIKADGSIGIGTDKTTGFLVSVDGNMRVREIIVNADVWADYVFDSAYVLLPLEEVARFIALNRRLPDVPSEEQVTEEGVNVAEMNRLLLQKIEELYLYILELNARVRELESEPASE